MWTSITFSMVFNVFHVFMFVWVGRLLVQCLSALSALYNHSCFTMFMSKYYDDQFDDDDDGA